MRVRILAGVVVVLDRDARELFLGGAELVHVPHHHHRVVPIVVTAHREIIVRVRRQRDELIAFGRLDLAHGLETHRRDHLVTAAGDGFPSLLKA